MIPAAKGAGKRNDCSGYRTGYAEGRIGDRNERSGSNPGKFSLSKGHAEGKALSSGDGSARFRILFIAMLAMLYFSIFHNPPSIDSRFEKTLPLFNHKLVFPTCANNFIIEVSLRGGEIVGVKTAKAI